MTKRAGVIGHPLGHSLSPAIFNAAFARAGIDAAYEAWDTEPAVLEGRLNSLRAADYLGANVTIPHKEAVVPLLDSMSDLAKKAGAVNTIVHADGKLVGHNTDVAGFARSLREDAGFEAKGKRTMILGSGGAARAVALALIEAGASLIYVVGRKPRKIDAMVVPLKALTPERHDGHLGVLGRRLVPPLPQRGAACRQLHAHRHRRIGDGRRVAAARRPHPAHRDGVRSCVQPGGDAVDGRGEGPRREGRHRPRHARVSGRGVVPPLDRAGRRHRRHVRGCPLRALRPRVAARISGLRARM